MLPSVVDVGSPKPTPLVSVITVVFRDAAGLRTTLQSLRRLPVAYEVVIVEGESADTGSAHLVVQEVGLDCSIRLVQGRDRGPYDAMNRGLIASRGDWVWMMNAGDEVAPDFDVQEFDSQLRESSQAWLCGSAVVARGTERVQKSFPGTGPLQRGVDTPCHQAMLIRRTSLMATGMFDTRLHISADYKMMCQISRLGEPDIFDSPICVFYRGGMSESRWRRREFENFLVRARTTESPRDAFFWFDLVRMMRRVTRRGPRNRLEQSTSLDNEVHC